MIELNEAAELAELERKFQRANEALAPKFQAEIEADKWPPDSRDIVDTGALRDSYEGFIGPDGKEYFHSWNVDYAAIHHEGAILANGGQIAAKPWTKEPLEDFPQEFDEA